METEQKGRKPKKLGYIARENMRDLLEEANQKGIHPNDIVAIVVKNNTFNLVYGK